MATLLVLLRSISVLPAISDLRGIRILKVSLLLLDSMCAYKLSGKGFSGIINELDLKLLFKLLLCLRKSFYIHQLELATLLSARMSGL